MVLSLTPREQEVMELYAQGYRVPVIGGMVGMAETTVYVLLRNIWKANPPPTPQFQRNRRAIFEYLTGGADDEADEPV